MARRVLSDRRGATSIEYGFTATLIAVAILGAVVAVGTDVADLFRATGSVVEDATDPQTGQPDQPGGSTPQDRLTQPTPPREQDQPQRVRDIGQDRGNAVGGPAPSRGNGANIP
jgi:Flp pilus assembly pilin Flp